MLSFLSVLLKSTLIFVFAEVPIQIAGVIVVPAALLFCNEQSEHLPKWASWFDEHDFGINGDPGWQSEVHADGHQREYKWRWRWLMRNKINTYSKLVTGFKRSDIKSIVSNGKFCVSDQGGCNGMFWAEATLYSGKKYQEYYFIYRYSKGYCIRVRFGWKLKPVAEEFDEDGELGNAKGLATYIQHGWNVNPVMRYLENK